MAIWSPLLARPSQAPLSSRPSLTLYFLLVGAFVLTLVPHMVRFPFWLTVVIATAMGIRSIMEVYRLPMPSLMFSSTVAIVFGLLIVIQFGGNVMGRDPGMAFTAGLIAIKFYELRQPRDVALIIFSCFFVVMSALLYDQYLELFVYCLIMMWVLTALLLRLNTGDQHHDYLIRMLGRSGIIFVQALPLGLFLFFFLPRYGGTFRLSLDDARIGITDTVSPGSIAKLSRDGSIAMYVRFGNRSVPLPESMYWRALVLWQYSGGAWTPGNLAGASLPKAAKDAPAIPDENEIRQDIVLKANYQRWLLALDVPTSKPVNVSEDKTWATQASGDIVQLTLSSGKVNHIVRYSVTSSTTPPEEIMTMASRDASLQLPPHNVRGDEHIDHSVVELADHLHQGLTDNQEQDYIAAVMHFFRHGDFTYNLEPGIQGPDWLPVFLFKTRTGFCEHFASAFAVLMRLEHIPARLVVGYQGGDYVPYSNLYGISQSNAHAWDEVWVPSDSLPPATSVHGHWQRWDPTASTDAAGGAAASATDGLDTLTSQVSHRDLGMFDAYLPAWAKEALRETQLRREQMDSDWDNIIISFDPETQTQIGRFLGFGSRVYLGLCVACLVVGAVWIIIFRAWMLRKDPVPPVESLYAAFCRTMARRGMPRAAWEGPLAYTGRVAEALPVDRAAIQRVGTIVARARYGPVPADAAAHEDLKSLLAVLTASQAATVSREKR